MTLKGLKNVLPKWIPNRPIQVKCIASVTNCGDGLETAMAPTVNIGWKDFTNGKYW